MSAHGPAQWSAEAAAAVIDAHKDVRGPLLPVLHALHEEFGYLHPDAVPLVARALNVSRADVHGVITFYTDFRTSPPGRRQVAVCRGEACQSSGGRALAEHAQARLGTPLGTTTDDGATTLDQVFCLGLCSVAPAVVVDGRAVGRVDTDAFDRLVAP